VTEVKGRRPISSLHWLPQYISLILGILIQPFFSAYQHAGHWNFVGFSGRILFALIIGLAIFPAVYKSAFDPEKPLFVQLCAIFAAGMGWESLLKTALKVSGI
jgi:hypothetical protein